MLDWCVVLNHETPVGFLARLEAEGGSVPHFVQQEFDDYLKCGLLEHGFLRVKCTGGVQRVSISGAAPPTPISLSIPPSSWIGLFFTQVYPAGSYSLREAVRTFSYQALID